MKKEQDIDNFDRIDKVCMILILGGIIVIVGLVIVGIAQLVYGEPPQKIAALQLSPAPSPTPDTLDKSYNISYS